MNPAESKNPIKSEFKELSIYTALVPVFALILMLFYNVFFFLEMMHSMEVISLY